MSRPSIKDQRSKIIQKFQPFLDLAIFQDPPFNGADVYLDISRKKARIYVRLCNKNGEWIEKSVIIKADLRECINLKVKVQNFVLRSPGIHAGQEARITRRSFTSLLRP